MTQLATFAIPYMTAVLLELAEGWRHPTAFLATLALAVPLIGVGITRLRFLAFLAVTSAYFLLVPFPDVANHVYLILYCNLVSMTGIAWSLIRKEGYPADNDVYELLRPVLQVGLILVYVLAGFAKLNTDFLDPEVSCVGMLVGNLGRMAGSVAPWLGAASEGIGSAAPGLIVAMALLVILWELVFGLLLAVPAMQAPVLAFSWTMHATLAFIGFVDFGALALVLLLTFVPRPYADRLSTTVRLPGVRLQVHRTHLYLAVSLLAAAASALGRRLTAGLCFNLAALLLLWPIVATAGARDRPPWRGVPLTSPLTPRWLFLFPLLLLLHGVTSYVGLRTAGNFTMYSNLRTEGARSNHLLLGANPLKGWSYQEDAVRFIRIDDASARIGYQYQPLEGNQLPVVEFRKLIWTWTRAGVKVPMMFEYRGITYVSDDIVNDPVWRSAGRDWEMRLMDFRVIQTEGDNHCRW